jgi:hypothetical protein
VYVSSDVLLTDPDVERPADQSGQKISMLVQELAQRLDEPLDLARFSKGTWS